MSEQARSGDTVRVHYKGTLRDGSVFDSSEGRDPLEFRVGGGQVIPGFDAAVTGMRVGDEKTVTIPADQAYGPAREEMKLAVPRAQIPSDLRPKVGDRLQLSQGGQQFVVVVREVSDDQVVLDANHPLAGEELTFALTRVG